MVIKLNQHQRCCILACTKFECSFISEGENSPIQFHGHMATSTIEGCWFNYGICCFSAKHAALRRKRKECLARNHDNVSEWGDMSIRGLLFQ
jgi:hypothetical protein